MAVDVEVEGEVEVDAISSMWSSAGTNNKAKALAVVWEIKNNPQQFPVRGTQKISNFQLGLGWRWLLNRG